ncbi:hypothetical protein LWF01_18015 [Saxibacter everestensis]|uniref:Uncharacterized protein n=1 Tax=Saxibacter everestensis TaxID=2909229 RepID=A0ABY8QU55_9MICO|nr:hypothetical protein LWF01_18015 [Brevibacteriaceae bacterium ZFBP1038]
MAALKLSVRVRHPQALIVGEYAVLGHCAASLSRIELPGKPGESRRYGSKVRTSVFGTDRIGAEIVKLAVGGASTALIVIPHHDVGAVRAWKIEDGRWQTRIGSPAPGWRATDAGDVGRFCREALLRIAGSS